MKLRRSSSGGRRPVSTANPFYFENNLGEPCNALWEEDPKLELQLVDLVTGCVRAFTADSPSTQKQDYVNWVKVIRAYKSLPAFTRPEIQSFLRCSESQAKRYIRVVKFCNVFIERSVLFTEFTQNLKEFENEQSDAKPNEQPNTQVPV